MAQSILLIDDEQDVVVVEKELLECLGYEVTAMTSGSEAIACFKRDPARYSLVITDYNMPDLDGLELTCQFKRLSPQTPVVLVSGFLTLSGDTVRTAGVAAALTKPLGLEELGRTVRRTIAPAGPDIPH
ncbi:MAG: C4-dicarboxylate transport transcriptional regulatory protein DctD [Deltaproteobacteria bacterium ADurb.Bin510]|nr:MAG: C4-dicarboxylate transport transcriptional regulatory protein DctD [Deltaproteobacteria bacterium ADurb.Bin510]